MVVGTALQLSAQSVQVVVTMRDGTEQTYLMESYDRMYFEENEKLIIEEGQTKASFQIPLADIRKINCYETMGTHENLEQPLTIFPNPVHETLTLLNFSGRQTVNIYTLDGRLVKSEEVVENQPIDISNLAIGFYLVKTDSQTLKMIKL